MALSAADTEEIASLERVLDRLGGTDETRLEAVLDKLLPPLIGKLVPGLAPPVQGKVLAVLSHINKRVKERPQIALPVEGLLTQLQTAAPFTANFVAVYLRMGVGRMSPPQLGALLPRLLGVLSFPMHARELVIRTALHALPHASFSLANHDERTLRFAPFAGAGSEAALVAATLLAQTLLFAVGQRRACPFVFNPLLFPAPAVAAAPQGQAAPIAPQPGVSAQFANLVGLAYDGSAITNDELAQRKRGAVALLGAPSGLLLPPELALWAAVAGCADTHHDVLSACEDLVKRFGNSADLESPAAISALTHLVVGGPLAVGVLAPSAPPAVGAGAAAGAPAAPGAAGNDAASPAPAAVRIKAMSLLCRSKTAVRGLPGCLRIIFECLFGAATTARLRTEGVRFAALTCQLADPAALAAAAPLLLQALQRLLPEPVPDPDTGSLIAPPAGFGLAVSSDVGPAGTTARDFADAQRATEAVYSCTAVLVSRCPGVVRGSLALPRLAFARLVVERSELRLAAGELLSALAGAYAPPAPQLQQQQTSSGGVPPPPPSAAVLEELHGLLADVAAHPDHRVRLAVLDWAVRIFPFSNARARFLCIRLVGDSQPEVREAARRGLRPPPLVSHSRGGPGGSGTTVSAAARLTGALAEADRSDLGAFSRQSDVHKVAGGDDPGSGSDAAGDVTAVAPSAGEEAFVLSAPRYPLFQSIVRFLTSHPLDEGSTDASGDGASPAASPSGGGAQDAAIADAGAPVSQEVGGEGEPAVLKRPRLAAPVTTPPTATGAFVDCPDTALAAVRPSPATAALPCLALAAALEFASVCLDASACVAGVSPAAYIVALDLDEAEGGISVLHAYRCVVELGLAVDPARPDSTTLLQSAAGCLLRLLDAAPTRLCGIYSGRLAWLLRWLQAPDVAVRRSMAGVFGIAAAATAAGFGDTAVAAADTVLRLGSGPALVGGVASAVSILVGHITQQQTSGEAAGARQAALDLRHGALLALGVLVSRASPAARAALDLSLPTGAILSQLSHPQPLVREAAVAALASVARAGPLPLPLGDKPSLGDAAASLETQPAAASTNTLLSRLNLTRLGVVEKLLGFALAAASLASGDDDATMVAVQAKAAAASAAAARSGGSGAQAVVVAPAVASAAAEAAIACLGAMAAGEIVAAAAAAAVFPNNSSALQQLPPVAVAALTALVRLAPNRSEALQFAVGAALVEACGGPQSSGPHSLVSSSPSATRGGGRVRAVGAAAASDVLATVDTASSELPGFSGTVDRRPRAGPAHGGGGSGSGDSPAEVALFDAATDAVLTATLAGPFASNLSHERSAAAVWLLVLVHGLGAASRVLQRRLREVHSAFMRLLAERSAFTQEAAGKGLALVYDCGGPEVQRSLVASLVSSFETGKRGAPVLPPSAAAGDVHAASTAPLPVSLLNSSASDGSAGNGGVAPEASIGAGPSGLSLSAAGDGAYRELCAMANEAGSPELIYRFLALASHHAAWHTRGGAGVALEALLHTRARATLGPHLEALIPRLYRYMYDPAPRVREGMGRLWAVLVPDPRAAVAAHIGPILADLITASQADSWRVRESACSALTDALQGREYRDVAAHLLPLWRASLRAIDDIKDSVRDGGLALLKALGKLTLRLCDPSSGHTTAAEGRAVVGTMVAFLVAEGVTHPVKDAQVACRGYLRDLAVVAGPLLRPHIPELVATALAGMADAEAAALAHVQAILQMHADAGTGHYGDISGEKLEAMRIAATRSGPLADIIDKCLDQLALMSEADLTTPPQLPPQAGGLQAPLEAATGLASGAGGDDSMGRGEAEVAASSVADGAFPVVGGVPASIAGGTPILPALLARLRDLILRGTGAPTRGATLRVICRVAPILGQRLSGHLSPLLTALRVLLGDAGASATLRKEAGNALAVLSRVCKRSAVDKLLARIAELAGPDYADNASMRRTAAQAAAALLREAGTTDHFRTLHDRLVPLAFSACHDSDESAREAWEDVWATLAAAGARATLQLYIDEVAEGLAGSLGASSWSVKRQGGVALSRLLLELTAPGDFSAASAGSTASVNDGTATGPGALPFPVVQPQTLLTPASNAAASAVGSPPHSEAADSAAMLFVKCATQHRSVLRLTPALELRPHARRLAALLLRAIPGRVWEGKEALVAALGQLAARCPAEVLPLEAHTHGEVAASSPPSDAAGSNRSESDTADVPAPTAAPDTPTPPGVSGAAPASAPTPAVAEPVVSAAAVVHCLATQAARDSVPVAYATAAASALALALAAAPPGFDAFVSVAASLETVVRVRCKRCGLPQLLPPHEPASAASSAADSSCNEGGVSNSLSPSTTVPSALASAAAPVVVVGGRFNEAKQSEGRLAAKAADAELAGLAAACYIALAAALPPALVPVSLSPGTVGDTSCPTPAAASESWLAAYTAAHAAAPPLEPASFCAFLCRAVLVAPAALATQAAHAPRLLACLSAALGPAAQQPHELAAVARALAVAFSALCIDSVTGPELIAISAEAGAAAIALAAAASAEDKHAAPRNACLAAVAALLQRAAALGGGSGAVLSPLLPPTVAGSLRESLLGVGGALSRMPEPHTVQWLRVCAALLPM